MIRASASQLMLAKALREWLPRVGEVLAAGQISCRQVNAIVYRTALVRDPEARAKIDVAGWRCGGVGVDVGGQDRDGDRLLGGSL
jgi:hypothetical protein